MSQETLSTIEWGGASKRPVAPPAGQGSDGEPFDWLPKLSTRQVRLEKLLAVWTRDGRLPPALEWLEAACGGEIAVDRPEVFWRPSGLNRPGMIAHLTAPRRSKRLAIGIENGLAHAVVDRLLGFDRALAESRLQLTPVEWGIWTFLILRVLDGLHADTTGSLLLSDDEGRAIGPGDVRLDRAGPDPFDHTAQGSIVTVRWGVRVGDVGGSVRLWIPESLVRQRLESPATTASAGLGPATRSTSWADRVIARGDLSSLWRAVAGTLALPQGLRPLREGGLIPLPDIRLSGSPASPAGPVDLVLDLEGPEGRFRIPARPVPDTGGRLLRLEELPLREARPRDPLLVPVKDSPTMSQPIAPPGSSPAPDVSPLDVPVTLTVELGRVNLTLTRLADLKPGDVVELSRHSRAPVELTSNGRLVARGELILIDTDLGVRVTSVFL